MTVSFLATIAIIFFLCISRHTPCSSALILCYPGLRCDNVPSSHCVTLAEEKQSLHSTETGYPPAPFTLLQPSHSFFFHCHFLLHCTFSSILSSIPLLCTSVFLSSRLLSGHASDPSVIFLYAFYLKFYI